MGMYIMHGETFLKTYINEDPDVVLNTQYVIVSSSIRKAGRYEGQIINANMPLYPDELLLVEYEDYKDPAYVSSLEDMFSESLPFLATLIQYCLDEETNIVFLCAKREWKYRYFQIMKDFVLEKFGYHIYDYKKVKSGKEKIEEDDDSLVAAECREILKQAKKRETERLLSSERGVEKLVSSMSKSTMIKKLKSMNLYVKDMDKEEMRETLRTFL